MIQYQVTVVVNLCILIIINNHGSILRSSQFLYKTSKAVINASKYIQEINLIGFYEFF